jgi:hypothetical protein
MRRVAPLLLLVGFVLGCGGAKQWEVAVENQSDVPCTFAIDLGPGNSATVKDVGKGKRESILVGSTKATVRSVKVTREGKEEELKPETELVPGKKFVVTVAPDGKATTSLTDR